MEDITNAVVEWLKTNGASLVGISDVERFDGAPRGHHPRDFLPEAKSVATFGVALLHRVLNWEGHLADSELVTLEHRKDLLQSTRSVQQTHSRHPCPSRFRHDISVLN